MIWKIVLTITVLVNAAAIARSQRRTLDYKYPGGVMRVSFDPPRIMPADLNRWVQLLPALSPYNNMLIPENIEACKAGDVRYQNCGHTVTEFSELNARQN